jgi:thiol-disulfide isomerase/thioredoxin
VLARSPRVLAYFTAAWCGPCKAIAPHFAALAKEHGSAIQFVKVDIDDNADATEAVSARSPHMLDTSMCLTLPACTDTHTRTHTHIFPL